MSATSLLDLAKEHPELGAKAKTIFLEAHQEDQNWPLSHRAERRTKISDEAWAVKKKRDQSEYVPENAVPLK